MEVYPETMEKMVLPYRSTAAKRLNAYLDVLEKSPAMAVWAVTQMANMDMKEQMAIMEEFMRKPVRENSQVSLATFMRDPLVKALCHRIDKSLGKLAVYSFVADAYQRALWQEQGRKVYEIAPGLAEHLTNTEVHNVLSEYVRLPFKSICIQVPWQAHLTLPKRITDYMLENGFDTSMRTDVEAIGDRDVASFIVSEGAYSHGGDHTRAWQLTVVADGQRKTVDGDPDFACYSFEIPLVEGKTIQECIDLRNAHTDMLSAGAVKADPYWEKYFKWVLNFVLYLSYEPTCAVEEVINSKEYRQLRERIIKLPPSPKKEKLKERLRAIPAESRLYVGRGHPRIPTVTEPGSGVPLTVRIMVTGHWRNQACGTGWQDHKMIWIRPFWRGPIGAEHNPRRIAT